MSGPIREISIGLALYAAYEVGERSVLLHRKICDYCGIIENEYCDFVWDEIVPELHKRLERLIACLA